MNRSGTTASAPLQSVSSKALAMRRPRNGSYRVAAAVALLVATTQHQLASAFCSRTVICSSPGAADITRVRRFGSENRRYNDRFCARSTRPAHALNIKSPQRTVIDAEEKTATTAPANGDSPPANSFLRFFDGTSSDNNDGNQNSNGESNTDNTKGPLGFLKRDVSPLAIDEEWTFSLNSADSSAASQMQRSETGDNDSTEEDVAMMAGAGIFVALVVAAVTALGLGVVDDFR
mmetsp:Transcript_21903/g.62848  ORF Transcript_21903/g.62848 Transcript_21903/m.62848 type:complete len:233 (+) Transcript_21903:36-734(+)